MRTVLVGIAGRVLAERDAARQRALSGLQRCEAFAAGEPADTTAETRSPAAAPAFPPLGAEGALLEEVSPSWLGVRFRSLTPQVREQRGLTEGAVILDAVYPDSPAREAGLDPGDILLGPAGRTFQSSRELREWTLVAPRGVPLALAVLRPDETPAGGRPFEAKVVLRVAPVDWPKLPDPPRVGDKAPDLPSGLQAVRAAALPELKDRSHLVFFWATWCGPCKRAVPEVLALAASRGLPVLAISDEDADTVRQFLADRPEPFFAEVAVDPMRKSFQSFGVSGTPTLLLVDPAGVIRHRQVGYTPEKGVTLEGWRWTPPGAGRGLAAALGWNHPSSHGSSGGEMSKSRGDLDSPPRSSRDAERALRVPAILSGGMLAGVSALVLLSYLNWQETRRVQKTLEVRLAAMDDRLAQLGSRAAPAAAATRGPDPNRVYSVKTDGAPVRGPVGAPVTIVEFTDFQCPFCGRVGPTLEQVRKAYGDQVASC